MCKFKLLKCFALEPQNNVVLFCLNHAGKLWIFARLDSNTKILLSKAMPHVSFGEMYSFFGLSIKYKSNK